MKNLINEASSGEEGSSRDIDTIRDEFLSIVGVERPIKVEARISELESKMESAK